MAISSIQLFNFRNFKKREIEFSPKTTVIVGPNASGKTNILEAIYLLATGKSFRARVEAEVVNYREEVARVCGEISQNNKTLEDKGKQITKLEAVLTRGKIKIGDEKYEKVPRKKLLINGIAKRLFNFAGILKVVLFGPWDLELVTESPSVRRSFLDNVLSQVDREYRRAILSYEKGLRQRNKLLYRIREEGISRSSLLFWDQLLIKNGNYISDKRNEFIGFVNGTCDLNSQDFSLTYDSSAISEGRLNQYEEEEVAAATTLVGPHRDDFVFKLKKNKKGNYHDLSRFGSRGEQRMGVLWLKLAELSFIESVTQETPTLLLDDIFSELDAEHRKIVMNLVDEQQTIITTADEHFLEGINKKNVIRL